MIDIRISRVGLKDIGRLQQLARETFAETFAKSNSEHNMADYLTKELSLEKIFQQLTNNYTEFYFAQNESDLLGYLKINQESAQTEIKDSNGLEIERIYVYRRFHGGPVGQLLLNKALDIARQKSLGYVWLGVWEENPRAIQFYRKHGFVEFDQHVFKLGNDEQTDIMMKLKLV